jgi:hypothetical protein
MLITRSYVEITLISGCADESMQEDACSAMLSKARPSPHFSSWSLGLKGQSDSHHDFVLKSIAST